MAKEFVRNIRNTKCIGKEKEPLYTNEQNDLLNQSPDVYVRNEDYYHCLTNAIQKIDSLSKYIDVLKKENSNPVKDKVSVEISTGELEKELNQIQRDLSNLYNVEIVELKEAIKELNDTIQNLPLSDLEEFKKKISDLEYKINNGLSDLEKEIEKINSRLDSLKSTRSSTIVIANYNSHENSKKGADIVINEGENASEKINKAIKSLSVTGGEVKIMEGIYNIEYGISINYSNISLVGIPGSTILKQNTNWKANSDNGRKNIIDSYGLNSNESIYIYGLTIEASKTIEVHSFSCHGKTKVSNCTVNNSGSFAYECNDSSMLDKCIANNSKQTGFNCTQQSVLTRCISNDSEFYGFGLTGFSQATNCESNNSGAYGIYLPEFFEGVCAFNILKNDGLVDDSKDTSIVEYNIIKEI